MTKASCIRIGLAVTLAGLAAILLVSYSLCGSERRTTTPADPELIPAHSRENTSPAPWYPAWWGKAPEIPASAQCKDPGMCVSCHEAQANMDPSHAFACVRCHGGDPRAEDTERAHAGIVSDPGDLKELHKTCGKCHPEEAKRVKSSAMALAPRMIAHTRFAFGAQKEPTPVHGTMADHALSLVPHPSRSSNLGDDLLRRSCLRCHLYTRGSDRWGEHRGVGCSACHVPYANSADGKSKSHSIIRSTGITACLKCHNGNRVGADYVGLYEKDFHRGFHSPYVGGAQGPTIYGAEQHRLTSDVHFRAGMPCTDCHTLDEIHGSGKTPTSPEPGVCISCESCHVRGDHPAVLKTPEGTMTLLRGGGRTVPRWKSSSIAHRVDAHRTKVRCSACHAAWSFQDYGLHLMLEERADYWKWAPISEQNDPQIQALLRRYVGTFVNFVPPLTGPVPPVPEGQWGPPLTRDWISGEERPGAWYRGHTARRWSRPPLGQDHRGRVSVMRPMHQYVVSHVDAQGKLLLDRKIPTTGHGLPALIFNPYAPHTIARKGRACQDCHGSAKAAGLGELLRGFEKPTATAVWRPESQIPGHQFRWDALVDENGKVLQNSTHPGAGPLSAETMKSLLNPSDRHRAAWYLYLRERMPGTAPAY